MKRYCIVRYPGFDNYSNLKEVSERNKQRILEAKKERETLGGSHHHKDQCSSVPDDIGENYCIHLEPCYKKFTLILAGASQTENANTEKRTSTRKSSGEISAWTYPDVCNICKKARVQHKGEKVNPVIITSFQAQATIKAAAKAKNEEMYNEIQDLDLMA